MSAKIHLSFNNTLASPKLLTAQVTSNEVNQILNTEKVSQHQKGVWYGKNTDETCQVSIKFSVAINNSLVSSKLNVIAKVTIGQ